jgi:hypothetical protein
METYFSQLIRGRRTKFKDGGRGWSLPLATKIPQGFDLTGWILLEKESVELRRLTFIK